VLRSRSRVGRRGRVRASVRSRPRTARGSSVDGRSTGDTVSTTLIEHEQRFRRIVSDYEYSSHPIVRAATAMPRGRDYALTERAWPGHEPRCRPARRAVRGLGQRARCRRRRGRPAPGARRRRRQQHALAIGRGLWPAVTPPLVTRPVRAEARPLEVFACSQRAWCRTVTEASDISVWGLLWSSPGRVSGQEDLQFSQERLRRCVPTVSRARPGPLTAALSSTNGSWPFIRTVVRLGAGASLRGVPAESRLRRRSGSRAR
jgi:hypothetical protein